MIEQQTIINSIYTVIKEAVGDSIGNRIYEFQGPDDETIPYITFQIISDVPIYNFKDELTDLDFQVNLWGEKKYGVNTLRSISDTLVNELNRKEIEEGVIKVISKGEIEIVDEFINIRTEYNILF